MSKILTAEETVEFANQYISKDAKLLDNGLIKIELDDAGYYVLVGVISLGYAYNIFNPFNTCIHGGGISNDLYKLYEDCLRLIEYDGEDE